MGLLPEVSRRKLYEKKGFHSIFEFAKKLAEQVKLLPQSALETLVRDEREYSENNASAQNKNGLQTGLFQEKSVRTTMKS